MPLVFDGLKLIRAKTSILEVAAKRGHVITAEADMPIPTTTGSSRFGSRAIADG